MTMEAGLDERRSETRQRALLAGSIVFHGGKSGIDCTIRNLSDHGAQLRVADSIGVPDVFELLVKNDQRRMPARVIWRKPDLIGVRFDERT